MEFIATYWWVWALGLPAFFLVYVMLVLKDATDETLVSVRDAPQQRLAFCALGISVISGLLFAISIALNFLFLVYSALSFWTLR